MGLHDEQSAKAFVERILPGERKLLYDIIRRKRADEYNPAESPTRAEVHHEDLVSLWWANFLPYSCHGLLSNLTMVLFAEFIDWIFGIYFGVTVMSAAALGNTIWNLLSLGVVYYGTIALSFIGVKNPQLSMHQEVNPSVRMVRHGARVCGVLLGCVLGMVPLIFYDPPERLPPPKSYDAVDNEAENVELERSEGRLERKTTSAGESVPAKEIDDETLAPEARWNKSTAIL